MQEKLIDDFFSVDKTFAISASVSKSRITNSLYASQCLKDGIADYFREKYRKRPNVEVVNPDVRFNFHIHKDTAIISLYFRRLAAQKGIRTSSRRSSNAGHLQRQL